ncbi:MAG TPA: rhomboid family intramembrane serine protease [Actinomycetota bacterium]
MLPLRDDNPTRRPAFITLAIIALNVAAFLLWEPTLGGTQNEQQIFFFCHALIPYEVTHQTNLADGGAEARTELASQIKESEGEAAADQQLLQRRCGEKSWWQSIFVAMFLHGGWLHIGGNMLYLWIFGNNVEDKLGIFRYVLFYLAAGIAATAAQMALAPNSIIPNLGASGAIAGVLGAYLFMFPRRRVLTLVMLFFITFVYLPAWLVLGGWFILQLFSGVGELGHEVGTGSGVAFWAHIGGFAFGALIALLFFPKERFGVAPPPRRPDPVSGRGWGFRRRRGLPPDEENWPQ